MDVRVLGPIEVHHGHQLAIGGPRQRRILAALTMHRGEVVSADRLIDITWDGEPPDQPASNLKTYVYRLRNGLGSELAQRVVTSPPGYRLDLQADELDAGRFQRLDQRTG